MKTRNRLLAALLTLVMIISMLPISAFAENDPPATGTDIAIEKMEGKEEDAAREGASPAAPGELPGTGEDKEQGDSSGGEDKTAESTPTPEPSKALAKRAAPALKGGDPALPGHGEGGNQENAPETYPVTLICDPEAGGTISITNSSPTTQGKESFAEGETVYLRIAANSGYTFNANNGLIVNGETVTVSVNPLGGGYSASFDMPGKAAEVKASFTGGGSGFTILRSVSPSAGGMLRVRDMFGVYAPDNQTSFPAGYRGFFEIQAEKGYKFNRLEVNGVKVDVEDNTAAGVLTYSFTLQSNLTAVAYFDGNGGGVALPKYTVSVQAEPAEGGGVGASTTLAITPSPSVDVLAGERATVKAAAKSGYSFEGWYNGATFVSSDNPYTFTPAGDVTLTAKFKQAFIAPTPIKLIVDSANARKIYHKGDSLDVQGLKLSVSYNTGMTTELQMDDAALAGLISGYDSGRPGKQTLTVTHTDYGVSLTGTYQVTVVEKNDPLGFTITLDANRGTVNGSNKITVKTNEYGRIVQDLPTPSPIHGAIEFMGWSTEKRFDRLAMQSVITTGENGTAFSEDTTVYALWNDQGQLYYANFYDGDDLLFVRAVYKRLNLLMDAGSDPTKDGHSFAGWYADKTLQTPLTFPWPLTEDIDIFAKFEPASTPSTQHTVTFNIVNGTWEGGKTEKQVTVADGTTLTADEIPTPTPNSGYGVGAWDVNPVGQTVTGDADYTYSFTHYKISYVMLNGDASIGTAPADSMTEWWGTESREIIGGANLLIKPKISNETYDFGGTWYTDQACTQEADGWAEVSGDVTLYGKWAGKFSLVDEVLLDFTPPRVGDTIQTGAYTGTSPVPGIELSQPSSMAGKTIIAHANYELEGVTETSFQAGKTYTLRVVIGVADPLTQRFKGHSGGLDRYALTVTGADATRLDFVAGTQTALYLDFTPQQPTVSKPVNVTVTGKTASADYDGTEKSVSGFKFTAKDSDDGDVSGVTVTLKSDYAGAASIAKIDAGDYDMGLKAEYFEVTLPDGYTLGKLTVSDDGMLSIAPADISTATVNIEDLVYNSAGVWPEPTVTWNGITLQEGSDYDVACDQDVNVGDKTATITGKGNYTGAIEKTFAVKPLDASDFEIFIYPETVEYNGEPWTVVAAIPNLGQNKISVAVAKYASSTPLKWPEDFTLSWSDSTDVGTVTVTATMKGNYTGTINRSFTIEKATPTVTGVSVTAPATVYDTTAIGDIVLGFTDDPSGGSIELNDNQTLEVGTKDYNWTYTPKDTANYNTVTGTVSITVEKNTNPPTPTGRVEADPVSLSFGSVQQGYASITPKPVTIRNDTAASVTISALGGLTAFEATAMDASAQPVTLPYTLPAGESINLAVHPKSDLVANDYSETLTVAYNDGTDKTLSVALSFTVTGTPPQPITYTVKVTDDGNGTGSANPAFGTTGTAVTLTATPSGGYKFKEWKVISGNVTVTGNTFNIGSEHVEIMAVFELDNTPPVMPSYSVTVGADSTWTKDSADTLTVTVKRSPDDASCFSHFTGVEIDGTPLVRDTDYTASSGSTVVTLKAATLQRLSTGSHTVTVLFDDGKVSTGLTVKAASGTGTSDPGKTTPKTGDESNLALWSSLMFLSVAAMIVLLLYARKRKTEQ